MTVQKKFVDDIIFFRTLLTSVYSVVKYKKKKVWRFCL